MSKSSLAFAPASPTQDLAMDGSLVVLPTEDTTEQDLLTALLRASQAMACASALIVAHNHPSGDPKPSREDIETTRELKAAAEALEVELHDHVVIGHGKHTSFRSLGLL